MSTWVTTARGNLVNLDLCVSVYLEQVGGDAPWGVRAEVVAGPANTVLGLGRYASEDAARQALDAIRRRAAGLTGQHLDLRDDPTTW
ncbi:hypothetical protein EV189_0175 [Motilibacter rhizosphaerae]|uniref:Uncharacterized protein n=1 Tax=Motilibacter rhizosphaerae TaxID=598652 RepID=A0A4Q7NUX5_9ACTN|nr:hypothetical protein [Motilibacter rhizosphaerae]RZS90945.1 hypothetical protein EV189_0175 [Motilibacter rhizosphaerae]